MDFGDQQHSKGVVPYLLLPAGRFGWVRGSQEEQLSATGQPGSRVTSCVCHERHLFVSCNKACGSHERRERALTERNAAAPMLGKGGFFDDSWLM